MMKLSVPLGLALAFSAAVLPIPADAAGGDCYAVKFRQVRNRLPDAFGVEAWCTSLSANSKARGGLDLTANPDLHTQWFTVVNTRYRSGTQGGPSIGGAYTEVRSV